MPTFEDMVQQYVKSMPDKGFETHVEGTWRDQGPKVVQGHAYAAPAAKGQSLEEPPRKALRAPDGYEFTGEFRIPRNDWFLDTSSGRPLYVAGDLITGPFPILKWTGQPAKLKERAHQWLGESYVTKEPPMPTPPDGWKITARRAVQPGEFFMQSNDQKVWLAEKIIYKDSLFAWVVEPTIKRPAQAPWFTLTNQYRIPKVGEWFLAKGAGPVAAANDPVCLGPYDVVPTGPRWILELHK